MSEYQYYEFQTLDRPLTPAEQAYCDAKCINTYVTMGGISMTNGGPGVGGRVDDGDSRGGPAAIQDTRRWVSVQPRLVRQQRGLQE